MLPSLVLVLALAPAPSDLSPEAAEYNAKAMRFHDAGQFAPAVDEFQAAYQSMPDARRDLAGREQLLGSMRATLLDLHAQTGEAAPLCHLQSILQGHADALTAAYPDDPNRLEIRSARARHREGQPYGARLGVIGAVGSSYRRDLARADALHAEQATRSCTEDDRTRLRELLTATRREEGLMIALQRRRARLGFDLRQHRVGLTISGEF